MTCQIVQHGPAVKMIACGAFGTKGPCEWCKRPGTKLCDWPTGENKTCDRRMCSHHAKNVGPNKDYCPEHTHG